MTDDSQTNPKHAKRYTRRLIAALCTIIAVGCLAVWIPYNRKMETIDKIEAIGGLVVTNSNGPSWLKRLIGSEITRGFETIVEVDFGPTNVKGCESIPRKTLSHDDLELLTELGELRKLDLYYTDITDSGLDRLTHLKKLEELNLSCTKVTEEGLLNLADQSPGLKKIYIGSDLEMNRSRMESLAAKVRQRNPSLDVEIVLFMYPGD